MTAGVGHRHTGFDEVMEKRMWVEGLGTKEKE